jgi:hypothetical protein
MVIVAFLMREGNEVWEEAGEVEEEEEPDHREKRIP